MTDKEGFLDWYRKFSDVEIQSFLTDSSVLSMLEARMYYVLAGYIASSSRRSEVV